jgi:hypothetical protein
MTSEVKETPKIGKGAPGPGRPKGVPNKTTTLLKEAVLKAAEEAGGAEGMVGYLRRQAIENPGPFMSLLGKVLPTQLTGEDGGPVSIAGVHVVIVDPKEPPVEKP